MHNFSVLNQPKGNSMTTKDSMFKQVTLDSICGGALKELFDREMKNVSKNIADPNIPAKTKRVIAIKIEFLPQDDRKYGHVNIDVATRLPGVKRATAPIWFGKDNNGPTAFQNDPQLELPGTHEEIPTIGKDK
jgi:hypothetical protein